VGKKREKSDKSIIENVAAAVAIFASLAAIVSQIPLIADFLGQQYASLVLTGTAVMLSSAVAAVILVYQRGKGSVILRWTARAIIAGNIIFVIVFVSVRINESPSSTVSLPADKFGVVIADFGQGSQQRISFEGKQVAKLLQRQIVARLKEMGLTPHVAVVNLRSVIRNDYEALSIGKRLDADLVVWGWTSPDGQFPAVTNFTTVPDWLRKQYAPPTWTVTFVSSTDDSVTQTEIRTALTIIWATGITSIHKGSVNAAIREFTSAIGLATSIQGSEKQEVLAALYAYRGKAHVLTDDNRSAEMDFRYSLSTHPNYIAMVSLADLLESKQHHREAESHYYEALTLNPNSPRPYYGLGNIAYVRDAFSEAEIWYRRATEVDPTFALAYLGLGQAALQEGNESEAVVALRTFLAVSEASPDLRKNVETLIATIEASKIGTVPSGTLIAPPAETPSARPSPSPLAATLVDTPPTVAATPSPIEHYPKPAPIITAPDNQARFEYATLSWAFDATLADDEWFDVQVWKPGEDLLGIAWVKENQYSIGEGFKPGEYLWRIVVIQGRAGQPLDQLSLPSETRNFTLLSPGHPTVSPPPPYPYTPPPYP